MEKRNLKIRKSTVVNLSNNQNSKEKNSNHTFWNHTFWNHTFWGK
jgi:hypothetical protein